MWVVFYFLFCILMLNVVVIPNAFQAVSASILVLLAAFMIWRGRAVSKRGLLLFLVSSVSTVFYLIVGAARGAPLVALQQAIVIYIVAPACWTLVLSQVFSRVGEERQVVFLVVMTLLACLSVGLYYYLYLNFGANAVLVFGSGANVHIEEGYAGAIMHVFGPIIFLAAGFFAAPRIIKSVVLRWIVLGSVALVVAVSGRSAAVLGLVFGLFVYFTRSAFAYPRRALFGIIAILVLFVFVGGMLRLVLGVELEGVLFAHANNILEIGGGARTEQIDALILGASDRWFLGAGHGVGVSYIRSYDFPWRYEVVPLALLHKLGIVGVCLVVLPIILAAVVAFRRLLSPHESEYGVFFASAFGACLIAAATNPYLEAFTLQWMYLAPVCFFLGRGHGQRLVRSTDV